MVEVEEGNTTYCPSDEGRVVTMCRIEVTTIKYSYGLIAGVWQVLVEFDKSAFVVDLYLISIVAEGDGGS